MNTQTKIVLGILGACAAGVAIGLVTAPCSGKDTRAKISRTTGSWVNSLGQLISKGKERLTDATDKVRHAKSQAVTKVNRLKQTV
jgi:gas vesicle protein